MSSAELTLWQAYEAREPFGPLADEFRFGSVCASTLNPHLKREAKPLRPQDFMPALGRALREREEADEASAPPMSPESQAMALDAFFGFR